MEAVQLLSISNSIKNDPKRPYDVFTVSFSACNLLHWHLLIKKVMVLDQIQLNI